MNALVHGRIGMIRALALSIGLILPAAIWANALAQSSAPGAPPAVRLGTEDSDDASDDATALAKKLQNPIGDLYSFPFQNNTNFNSGPHKGTQDILNVQPVIPIHVNADWTVITRTILPLIWQPSYAPAHTASFGTGPTSFSAFLAPANPNNGWLWGVGPVIQLPTISDKSLGSPVWGAGPTAVLVYMKGPLVAGLLANGIFSFGGTTGPGGTEYTSFLMQPFANYNFGGGWYVGTSPLITANWPSVQNKAWTVPVGAQVGRVIKLGGKLPVNLQVGAYYNAVRPEYGATWQLKTQVTFIF